MATILVVDDEPLLLKNLATLLELEDFHVLTTEDGKTALEILQEQPVHLILCDLLMMPMDGFEILQAVRQNPRTLHIPFVLVTAMKWRAQDTSDMGASAYLIKPFTRVNLLETVNQQLATQNIH